MRRRRVRDRLPNCIVLVTRLAREPRVPRRRKLLLFALVGYLALPLAMPGFGRRESCWSDHVHVRPLRLGRLGQFALGQTGG